MENNSAQKFSLSNKINKGMRDIIIGNMDKRRTSVNIVPRGNGKLFGILAKPAAFLFRVVDITPKSN